MTIDERLQNLLALASPPPISAIGARWYANTAPKGVTAGDLQAKRPYAVYSQVGETPIDLHDGPVAALESRRPIYQFNLWGPNRLVIKTAARSLARFLCSIQDDRPGLRAANKLSEADMWDDNESLHGVMQEYALWEDTV